MWHFPSVLSMHMALATKYIITSSPTIGDKSDVVIAIQFIIGNVSMKSWGHMHQL